MIKSDKWIRSKCQQPDGYILPTDVRATDKKNWTPVFRGKDETITDAHSRTRASIPDSDTKRFTFISGLQEKEFTPMIEPFEPGNIRYKEIPISGYNVEDRIQTPIIDHRKEKILSYGTSSFGYDVTLADDFRIFTNINSSIIDPLNFDERCLVEFKGDVCIIPPNSYILGVTREYFRIPRNVMVICVGKSTYARCGAIVNVTPIEPGFEGHVVIEVSNSTNLPMKIYANQGIAQFMFFESDEDCEVSYADKHGKYQGQTGVTLAKG